MKKSFLMMAMFAMVFASCKKEPAPSVLESDPLGNEPVPVVLSASAPKASVDVKSVGALDTWTGQKIYVSAYEKATETDYSSGLKFLFENYEHTIDAEGEFVPKTTGQASYYYDPAKVYNFYGYYLDDVTKTGPTATQTAINYNITINGLQDVMVAKANPSTDLALSNDETLEAKYLYSAYSARRDVVPSLEFKHVLTRFNFIVKAKDESAYNVNIDGLKLKSKTKATLNVVGNQELTVDSQDTAVDLALVDFDATNNKYGTSFTQTSLSETTTQINLGHLMVMPGEESYGFVLEISPKDGGEAEDIPSTILHTGLKNGTDGEGVTTFQPGKAYDVTISLVGPEAVEVTATVADWVKGGDWPVDTEILPTEGVPASGQQGE